MTGEIRETCYGHIIRLDSDDHLRLEAMRSKAPKRRMVLMTIGPTTGLEFYERDRSSWKVVEESKYFDKRGLQRSYSLDSPEGQALTRLSKLEVAA
tara:strand:- start:180 stop:467 length:288 start_codon:yes stop_codon:yes gene_type:complete